MDRNEAYRLRERLAGGQQSFRDLTNDEFKGLIYWLLVDRFVAPSHSITLADECRGAVEVMVIEHLGTPSGGEGLGPVERRYFFECMQYGKSFGLADLGNLFCAAIRHQPETVALVSSGPLHAHVQDYADLFFGRGGRFPQVDFQNLHPELLLGLPVDRGMALDAAVESSAAATSLDALESTEGAEWRFIEHGVFHDRVIASKKSKMRSIRLFSDRRYTLDVRGSLGRHADPQEVHVTILSPDGRNSPFRLSRPPRVRGHDVCAQFTLAPEALAREGDVAWQVQVDARGSRSTRSSLRLPAVEVTSHVETLFPDCRSGVSVELSAGLREGKEVITFINGEAGVGKSYLCKQISTILKFEYGYRVENFRAENVADGSLLLRVLLRLLTPPLHDGNEPAASDFNSRVVVEALRCLLHEIAPTESESLSQAIAASDLSRAHPDRIVPLLAGMLAQSGDVLLVLQDCHELPSTLIAALDALVVALDELDWAGTRLVLEYRSGLGTDNNLAWTSFVDRVRSTLHSRTRTISLRNLTLPEVERYLRPLFDAINNELISAFWTQTGGNPLLLTSLVRSLVDTGALGMTRDSHGSSFQVLHPARILEGHPLRTEKPRLILENRIRLLDATKPAQLEALPSVIPVLAILALTEDVLSRDDVFRYFDLSRAAGAKLIRWLTREEILSPSGDYRSVTFGHDLIRDTVKELGRQREETLSVAERIVDEIAPEGYDALFRMAMLARYIGDLQLCREYLDRGQEIAKNENRFNWSRRFQLQLLDSLRALPNATHRDRLAQLSLLGDLGWSEYNTGSNRVAREYQREARQLAEQLPLGEGNWTPQLMRSTLSHVDHQIMGNDLELHDFQAFLGSAQRALERVGDGTVLGRIINRIVLGCSALGFVDEGMYFARAGVDLASLSTDPEVNAVLCTDISTFLGPACSGAALRIAEQGTGLAQSARQRMHSEFVYMRERLRAQGHVDPAEELEQFQRGVRELGMVVLEGTLCNFEGVVQLINHGVTEARHLFSRAEILARLYGKVALEPVIWNNAMIAALLGGDIDSAKTFSDRLLRFWRKLAEERRLAEPRWHRLIATFEAARGRMTGPLGARVIDVPPAPPFAGRFLSSLTNLASLREVDALKGAARLESDVLLEEWTGSARPRLSRHKAVILEWNGIPLYLDP